MGCIKLQYYFKNGYRKNLSPFLNVIYNNCLDDKLLCWGKYQWDFIHDPQNFIISGLQEEDEGELISITGILKQIHDANSKEYNFIKIMQDQCPQVCYKNVKLDDNVTMSLLQINCSKEFEDTELKEDLQYRMMNWTATISSNINIKPSEKTKVFAETSKGGKMVYYKFHEVKEKPIPEAPEMTGNFLFEFVVPEKEAKDFEEYLYPKALINIEGIPYLSQLDETETKKKTGCESGCCQAASCWMINQKNNTTVNHNSRVYFAEAINTSDLTEGVTSILTDVEFKNVVGYIKTSIKSDKPVLFGTWDNRAKKKYPKENPKAYNDMPPGTDNSPTTHYMLIVGYGFDKDQNKFYFRFYDPGRTEETDGTSEINRLFIDESTKEISTTTYRDKTYKLTEIRRNF